MNVPLWTYPLLLAALLTILEGVARLRYSRKHTERIRPAWDVPDGVTALDVKALYRAKHPLTLTEAFAHSADAMRRFSDAISDSTRREP